MKALVFDGGIRLADLPVPEREKGQALIRVDLAGICNTDVEVTRVTWPTEESWAMSSWARSKMLTMPA